MKKLLQIASPRGVMNLPLYDPHNRRIESKDVGGYISRELGTNVQHGDAIVYLSREELEKLERILKED